MPLENTFGWSATNTYIAFVVALIISVLMHFEIRRMRRHYSNLEVETQRSQRPSAATSTGFKIPRSAVEPPHRGIQQWRR